MPIRGVVSSSAQRFVSGKDAVQNDLALTAVACISEIPLWLVRSVKYLSSSCIINFGGGSWSSSCNAVCLALMAGRPLLAALDSNFEGLSQRPGHLNDEQRVFVPRIKLPEAALLIYDTRNPGTGYHTALH